MLSSSIQNDVLLAQQKALKELANQVLDKESLEPVKELVVVNQENETPVDLGFDFVNFPLLSVDDQIRTAPTFFFKDI